MSAPKRPIYFQSQFLIVRDFQDEQKYHAESLQRHNRLMHEWGVIRDGLQVKKSGDNYLIDPGSAIDSLGREISLEIQRTLSAAEVQAARQASGAGQDVFVTIAFDEIDSTESADKYPPPGGTENVTRKVQSPKIVATKSPASDGTVVTIARIAADGAVNMSVRKLASSFIPRGTNLGDISLDGALSFTSKSSPTPQVGLDYDPAGDQLRIRARSQNAAILDTTYVTIKRDSGNVGIGTPDAPGQKLEVGGALRLTGSPTVINNNLGAYFWNQPNVGPTIAGLGFEVRTNGDIPRFKIYSSGNVGIGTTSSPGQKLEVAGALKLSTNSTVINDHSGAYFWNQENVGPTIAGGNFEVRTGGNTVRFRIDGSGNVGIGTTSAPGKLEVAGALKLSSSPTVTNDNNGAYFWNQENVGPTIAGGKFEVRTGGDTVRLRIDGTGNVGIGTTIPRSSLHIRKDNQAGLGPTLTLMNGAGAAGAKVHIDLHTYWDVDRPNPSGRIICEDDAKASGHLIFQTKQEGVETMLERLRIDASGKVGIGTNQPKAKLDVGDTEKFTMKAILARLPEASPGTFLGVKSYDTDVNADKSFAIEHHFYNELNCAINFHRGGGVYGGYITFDTNNGTRRMRLDDQKLHVEGSITCGGKIGLKSAKWTNRWLSARGADDGWVVRTQNVLDDLEEFTLVMRCSREFKENISDLTAVEAMTTLQNLTPVKYDYKGEKAFRPNLGFIAEDIPDNLSSEDRKSISPFEVVPILTRVAKEQQRVIAELQETVLRLQEDMRQIS